MYDDCQSSDGTKRGGVNPGSDCEHPIIVSNANLFQNIAEAGSYWYQLTMDYAQQRTIQATGYDDNDGQVTSVESKSLDCNAVSNVSNFLFPGLTYLKQGINLVKVTVDGPCQIQFQGQMAFACNFRPQNIFRINKLDENTETTYVNAVYETNFSFTPTETGTYTFTNKAPEGSTLKVSQLDEISSGSFSCKELGDKYTTTIGSNNLSNLAVTLEANEEYIITSETFALLDEGMPSLKVVKGDVTAINNIKADNKNDITVKNLGNGNYQVDSYLFKEGATVGVYNMAGIKLYEKTLQPQSEGITVNLNGKKADCYLFLVIGKSQSACKNVATK